MPTDDRTDDFLEASFAEVLRLAADGAPALGSEAMTFGATVRGRRRQRRRRAAAVGAAALAVLLVSGGAALAWQPAGATRATVVAPGDAPSAGPRPSRTASATPTVPAVPATDVQLLDRLRSLLPSWTLSEPTGHGTVPTADSPDTFASYVLDDGHGKAWLRLSLRHNTLPVKPDALGSCPDPVSSPYAVCHRTTLQDGSTLVLLQDWYFPARELGAKRWSAELDRPDGTSLKLTETNTPGQKLVETTRTDPPLTPAQLQGIVTDPGWRPALAAIPAVPAVSPADIARKSFNFPPSAKILEAIAPLLPDHLVASDAGGSDDSGAHFTVDDGRGKSLVEIGVQDWSVYKPGVSTWSDVTESFQNAPVLPDGTRVLRSSDRDYAGQPGLVRNGIDILRPDHLRVTIWSYNTPAQPQAPTRSRPVLSVDQLQALATNPVWETVKG
ncbi:hypothetical protein CFP65_7346 [Kitasatospora sp. MMS16-BH015]|uniref:hypothetical protein n=1 Tax=Kitasatospora sp. MMS16-BH015 TaxID=2018025 RepID=UPI000CA3A1EB|nr:hypothetical protein [Kitasatospora sp. MMS16-BH015]AUG81930.1 hypothetical protein CFP65_7346 [Kitasatospora sp. MMS16-BH015]